MSLFNKPLLSAAIAAVISSTSCSASANAIEDSTLDIKLRNAYFSKTDKYGGYEHNVLGEKKEIRQWAQSAEVNFASGYFGTDNFGIGADASYYGAVKLAADKKSNTGGDLLPQGDSGDINNYGKLAQGFAKLKAFDMVNLQAGRMKLDNPILASSGSRLTPSTFEAALGSVDVAGFHIWATRINEWSKRNQSGFKDFFTGDGSVDIDNATAYGVSYEHESGLGFEVAQGNTKDFIEKTFANVYYSFDLGGDRSLDLDGQYYTFEDDGKLWTDNNALTSTSKADKLDSTTYSLRAAYTTKWWDLALTYTKNKDDKAYYYMSGGDHGTTYLYTSMIISDFLAKEEDVYQIAFNYDFGVLDLPGFNAGYSYTYGKDGEFVDRNDPANGKTYNEWESEYILSYTVQEGPLKDLSFKYSYANYSNNAPAARSVDTFDVIEQSDNRFYVDYTLAVF
ncbi:OprD family outer membrane porin [Aestuariirhabdus sp. LZHN29]|uniref:OprD family outer membrane porin n=1 Tax=Aestuariirhabdus sp. LZHN29 TaxID=3417462 RepID=UPI003CEF1B24